MSNIGFRVELPNQPTMPICSSEFITRWTGDFADLVVRARETISDWEFRKGVYVANHYDDHVLKPIFLRMERPNSSCSGSPQQLHLLACKKVPVGAEQVCVGPGTCASQHLHSTHRNANASQCQEPLIEEDASFDKTLSIWIPCFVASGMPYKITQI